jgi:hypothetical protein
VDAPVSIAGFDECPQALVFFAARAAPLKVGVHARDRLIGVCPSELELDIAVEVFEALLAAQLRPSGTEHTPERAI